MRGKTENRLVARHKKTLYLVMAFQDDITLAQSNEGDVTIG